MSRKNMEVFLASFFLFFLLFPTFLPLTMIGCVSGLEYVSFEAPLWLEEGKYAKYISKASRIELVNWTSLYIEDGEATAIFEWECLSVEGDVAKLNITLTWSGEGTFFMGGAYERVIGTGFKVFKWSKLVYVDLQKNAFIFPNGTLIGPLLLWLPPRLEKGTTLEMYVNPNLWFGYYCITRVVGEVISHGRVVGKIAQGSQKAFSVEWKVKLKMIVANRTQNSTGSPFYRYDLDTGIALACFMELDPVLLLLGIWDIGVQGLMPRIYDTNVDLGPRVLSTPSWFELLPVLLVTGFLATFAVVYYQRRKKRRLIRARKRKRRNIVYMGRRKK